MPSNLKNVLDAFKTTISGLSMVEVRTLEVQKIHTLKPKDDLALPCQLIATAGGEIVDSFAGWTSTNERNLVVYPVLIYDVEASFNDPTDKDIDNQFTRRQKIFRAFHRKRLSGVSESMITLFSTEPIVYPASFRASGLRTSGLKFNAICRESRSNS